MTVGPTGDGRSYTLSDRNRFHFPTVDDRCCEFARSGPGAGQPDEDDEVLSMHAEGVFAAPQAPPILMSGKRRPPRSLLRPFVKTLALPVTLEQMMHGATEKVAVTTRRGDICKILTVNIEPGTRAGTEIEYSGVSYMPDGRPEDLLIILEEKARPDFIRQGDNLITTSLDGKESSEPLMAGRFVCRGGALRLKIMKNGFQVWECQSYMSQEIEGT